MNASRTMRPGGAVGHLLLLAALVFGIAVMHTLGHPSTPSGSHATPAHASSCGTTTGHDGTGAGGSDPSHGAALPQYGPEAAPSAAAGTVAHCPGSGMGTGMGTGMDMTTLCLAVLTVWAMAWLLRAIFRGRGGRSVNLVAAAVEALRPHPPPPRPPDLATLSILRI